MATNSYSWKGKVRTEPRHKQQPSIRDTIHLLLSLLSECGVPKVASECFRRAKFNQEDATLDLWQLTFHTMQIILFFDHESCGDGLDTITFHSVTTSSLPKIRTIMRRYLFDLGYEREEYYAPVNTVGSCELLLAFAWLLNRTKFFAKLSKHLMTANRTRIPLKPTTKYLTEHVIEENRAMGYELEQVMAAFREKGDNPFPGNHMEALHKLIWLKGRLDSKWKAVQRLCLVHQTLADKIHKSTCINSSTSRRLEGSKGHLSMYEVFLLRYPNQMKVYLAKLGQCVSMLQKLIQWQDCEPLFWQWMESILDLQEEKSKELNHDEDDDDIQPEALFEDVVSKVRQLQGEFEESMKRKRTLIDRIDYVWKHKSRMLHHKDINSKLHCIKKQLQFEYPIISTVPTSQTALVSSTVEQICSIDSPMYAPVQPVARHSRRQPFPMPVQLQQETNTRLIQALHEHLNLVTRELEVLEGAIKESKSSIRNCLESLEKRLPSAFCKIELNQ